MKQVAFCEYCMKENDYKVNCEMKTSELKDESITYMAKEAVCNVCGNEIFVSEIWDCNLKSLYSEYRRKHNLISVKEIKNTLIKYFIDEQSLSLLLAWKSDTISRYLEGDVSENSHSDMLKNIHDNVNYYMMILQSNKDKINPVSYSKTRQAVKGILDMKTPEKKIDAVIKYLLIRCEDFTPDALQKLLYYVQAFHYVFTKNFIFEEECRACIEGPVFQSVFERYEKLGYEEVNEYILDNKSLKLEDFERNIVESVIKFYSCYSGKILKQMTHNEAPWMLTRANLSNRSDFESEAINPVIDETLITDYFIGIKEKYNMINLFDIQKYSLDLFNKIFM